MSNLKVSLIQSTQFWEDKQANLDHFSQLMNQIQQTDLIVLPEMFHTAFSMKAQELAENCEKSETIAWLQAQAIQKQAAIYTSFIAKEKSKFYNRGIFVYPNGEYFFYDKRKLFTLVNEDHTYTAGKNQVIVSYKGWNINLQICYDLRFPEISRNKLNDAGEAEYDLCLYVANWPERRASHWRALLPARAIENQAYVIGLNRVGVDGFELTYSGDSNVYNALGEALAPDFSGQEKVIEVELDKTQLQTVRTNLNFLKDVRL